MALALIRRGAEGRGEIAFALGPRGSVVAVPRRCDQRRFQPCRSIEVGRRHSPDPNAVGFRRLDQIGHTAAASVADADFVDTSRAERFEPLGRVSRRVISDKLVLGDEVHKPPVVQLHERPCAADLAELEVRHGTYHRRNVSVEQ